MSEPSKADHAGATERPWLIPDISWEPWEGAIEIKNKGGDVVCYTTSGHGREKLDATLIVTAVNSFAAAEQMAVALAYVREMISEAAMTGFNWKEGDWPDRLFESQQQTSAALSCWRKATGGAE